jgi:hypothetical protein
MCQDEARWAAELNESGKSIDEIKAAIDGRFG